jgi:signal transduction histidine kinase
MSPPPDGTRLDRVTALAASDTGLADPFADGWRRRPVTRTGLRTDTVIAAGLLVGTILSLALYTIAGALDDPAPMWASLIWALFITLPLALRRRWPTAVAIVVSAAFMVGGIGKVPELLFCNIALFLALYTAGAWVDDRRRALFVRVGVTAAMLIWLVVVMFMRATDPEGFPGIPRSGAFSPMVSFILLQILTNVLYFGAAYYFGDRSYAAARQLAALEWRTRELERERERTAVQAVALERIRIARELHDVVAHGVSVMGVQAGAGRLVLESDPAAAREALTNVEASARSTLAELHRLLTTLREVEPGAGWGPEDRSAVVGVEQLPQLVAEATSSGVPTSFEVVGQPRPLPGLLSLNIYRIAQEALTNVRKHTRPQTPADVRLRYLDDAVEIEITNDGPEGTGRGPAAPGTSGVTRGRVGGLGQLGIRERVVSCGGALELGPRPRGGYLVRARLPYPGVPSGAGDQATDEQPTTGMRHG